MKKIQSLANRFKFIPSLDRKRDVLPSVPQTNKSYRPTVLHPTKKIKTNKNIVRDLYTSYC